MVFLTDYHSRQGKVKKWETVKTNHYLWAMGGGQARMRGSDA